MLMHGEVMTREMLSRCTGDCAAGGIREVVFENGAERGVRALEFRTGTGLCFDVLVDRAMDIGSSEFCGRAIGWRSASGFRHPGLHDGSDELAWLRSVSGTLATGGLDHTMGPAEVDASQYNLPSRRTIRHGLHGRVANIPARLRGYGEQWRGDRCTLWAEGEIRQAALFGEHLELLQRIEADLGSNEVRIFDTVSNRGYERTPHMLLYHFNFGWPLVDSGS